MKQYVFERRVPYYFTDRSGVIHHSNFFKLFEEARTEYFRKLGVPYSEIEKEGFLLVVVDVSCRYFGNASYDDNVEVVVSIKSVEKVTIRLGYKIYSSKKLIASGETKLACIDNSRVPRRLPEKLYLLLRDVR